MFFALDESLDRLGGYDAAFSITSEAYSRLISEAAAEKFNGGYVDGLCLQRNLSSLYTLKAAPTVEKIGNKFFLSYLMRDARVAEIIRGGIVGEGAGERGGAAFRIDSLDLESPHSPGGQ